MHLSSSRLCEVPPVRECSALDRSIEAGPAVTVGASPQRHAGHGVGSGPPCREGRDGPAYGDVAGLVKAAAVGDRSAWNALVDRFSPSVWAIARGHRLGQADAADVCQTTWLRLVEHLDRVEQPERVGAWLATTARREALRVIRLSSRQVPTGEEMDALPDTSPPTPDRDDVASKHTERVLDGLISQLPLRSRLLLRLLLADTPMSYKDISEALDMPIGSIGPTRARALDQLRRRAMASGVDLRDLRSV